MYLSLDAFVRALHQFLTECHSDSDRNAAAARYPFTRGHSERHFYLAGLVERASQFCLPVLVSVLNSGCDQWSASVRFRSLAESLLTARLSSRVNRSILCVLLSRCTIVCIFCTLSLAIGDAFLSCCIDCSEHLIVSSSFSSLLQHPSYPRLASFLQAMSPVSASLRPQSLSRLIRRRQRRFHTCTHCTAFTRRLRVSHLVVGHPHHLLVIHLIVRYCSVDCLHRIGTDRCFYFFHHFHSSPCYSYVYFAYCSDPPSPLVRYKSISVNKLKNYELYPVYITIFYFQSSYLAAHSSYPSPRSSSFILHNQIFLSILDICIFSHLSSEYEYILKIPWLFRNYPHKDTKYTVRVLL